MMNEKRKQETYIPRHLKKETINVEETKKHNRRIKVRKLLCIPLIVLSAFAILSFSNKGTLETYHPEAEESPDPMPAEYRNIWLENKTINLDYIGQIIFDSGLIDLPFVQAEDVYDHDGNAYVFYTPEGNTVTDVDEYTGNDVYIWKNWKTGEYDRYEEGGSVFMDYRNSLDDQNLIIYGHHFARDFDPSGVKQFTPLDLLLKEENYTGNSSLKLILNNEIRTYEICAVTMIDVKDDEQLQIARTDLDFDLTVEYDPGFFQNYLDLIGRQSVYDTGKQIQENDRLLTLI
ncbi:MAG: class B sortase, partial [Erysipelotrichaceae bacterium]|nr:class B sortase [Erysipelotrichaceae bacterium]